MNRISPAKLKLSKWTAVQPVKREKHFLVTEVSYHEDGTVLSCVLEAVHSKREQSIDWQELRDDSRGLQGWK